MTRLKERLAAYLREWAGLREADILCEYPPRRRLPLERPALVVGLEGVELSPAGLDGFLGLEGESAPGQLSLLYGSAAAVTLRLDLYLPGSDGAGCHRLYEELCTALTAGAAELGLLRIGCDPIGYDSAAAACRLTARARLRAAFAGRETQAMLTDYRVRGELA